MDPVPKLIEGNLFVDDRGSVSFVNDFNFEGIKRFYSVSNFKKGFIRAWHGHKREAKYVHVVTGVAIVCCIPLQIMSDYFNKIISSDDAHKTIQKYVLDSRKPSVLYIPPGYCNGFKTLTVNTSVMFMSTSTVEESKNDDYRFDGTLLWTIWESKIR